MTWSPSRLTSALISAIVSASGSPSSSAPAHRRPDAGSDAGTRRAPRSPRRARSDCRTAAPRARAPGSTATRLRRERRGAAWPGVGIPSLLPGGHRHRDGPGTIDRQREPVVQAGGRQRCGGGGHAGRIGAGDHPHRLGHRVARRGDEARPRRRVDGRRARRGRAAPACRRKSGRRRRCARVPRRSVGRRRAAAAATTCRRRPQRVGARAGAEQLARVPPRRRPSTRPRPGCRRRSQLGAHSTTVGKRFPSIPWTNGSGKEPTTAGIEFGLRPVVEVPPDVVAAVHRGAGRALLWPRSRSRSRTSRGARSRPRDHRSTARTPRRSGSRR